MSNTSRSVSNTSLRVSNTCLTVLDTPQVVCNLGEVEANSPSIQELRKKMIREDVSPQPSALRPTHLTLNPQPCSPNP